MCRLARAYEVLKSVEAGDDSAALTRLSDTFWQAARYKSPISVHGQEA